MVLIVDKGGGGHLIISGRVPYSVWRKGLPSFTTTKKDLEGRVCLGDPCHQVTTSLNLSLLSPLQLGTYLDGTQTIKETYLKK